jgi:hypothetical protein
MSALAEKFEIWGPAPEKDTPQRERWVTKHRPRLYDWLEILRQAGLISHESRGVRDNAKVWWRTEITVLSVPADLSADELAAAQAYIDGFPERERDRRRRGRERPYEAIFKKARRPTKAQKKRLAIARAKASRNARCRSHSGNFGGPCSPALPPTGATADFVELTDSDDLYFSTATPNRTGERRRTRPGTPDKAQRLRRNNPSGDRQHQPKTSDGHPNSKAPPPSEGRGEVRGCAGNRRPGTQRSSRRPWPLSLVDRATWVQEGLQGAQKLRERGFASLDLTDPVTLEAVTRAWYLAAYGEDEMMRLLPWCPRFNAAELVEACTLYADHLTARLPGMPADPIAALMRMASTPLPPYERGVKRPDGNWRTELRYPALPETIAYAIRGLRLLAGDMAAAEVLLADRAPRLRWPDRYQRPAPSRFAFRDAVREAWDEDREARRERVFDQLIAAGGNPRRHGSTGGALESMELELIDRERYGVLPPDFSYPSPTAMRAHRGAWMPDWYVPTPSTVAPAAAWHQILEAAQDELGEQTTELWLTELTPIELADETLTLTGPTAHVQFAATRLAPILADIAARLGLARRVQALDAQALENDAQTQRPAALPVDLDADGKMARARRHLRRIEAERRRLLTERDPAISDTAYVAARQSQTADNERWDQLLDIAATRPEFRSSTVVDLWLRPLLPHFGADGILTLTGPDATIENVRRHLGHQLEHLVTALAGGRGIRWHPTQPE